MVSVANPRSAVLRCGDCVCTNRYFESTLNYARSLNISHLSSQDDFVIPRIHRPGRGTARTPVSPSVLKSFLQPIPMTPPRKFQGQDDRREQLSPSVAGQPGTDDGVSQNKDEMLDPNDLDATLKFIYRPILGQEADSIIMDAKVDENEALYMDGAYNIFIEDIGSAG